uniref:Uncharacterized protein n=1 Tax=Stegastes partitus TaxID=144197 RepID=A0A3B4Z1B0_9TELE
VCHSQSPAICQPVICLHLCFGPAFCEPEICLSVICSLASFQPWSCWPVISEPEIFQRPLLLPSTHPKTRYSCIATTPCCCSSTCSHGSLYFCTLSPAIS